MVGGGCTETGMRVKMESLEIDPCYRFPIASSPDKTWKALIHILETKPDVHITTVNPKDRVVVWEIDKDGYLAREKQNETKSVEVDRHGKRKARTLEKQPRGYCARVVPSASASLLFCHGNVLWTNHPFIKTEAEELTQINEELRGIAALVSESTD